jgi:hypothetical protein
MKSLVDWEVQTCGLWVVVCLKSVLVVNHGVTSITSGESLSTFSSADGV